MNYLFLMATIILGMVIGTVSGAKRPTNIVGCLLLSAVGAVCVPLFHVAYLEPESFGIEGMDGIFNLLKYFAGFLAGFGFSAACASYQFFGESDGK